MNTPNIGAAYAKAPATKSEGTIEEAIAKACREHGLRALNFTYHVGHQHPFGCYTHHRDHDGKCGSGSGENLSAALRASLADLHETIGTGVEGQPEEAL